MSEAPAQIGQYSVEREIGRGGMGVVYLARDSKLDRAVAMKALPEHLAGDAERLARFEREAKTLAQLSHPNVAGIYGVEEQDGQRFLILEYVEGETLAERLDRGPLEMDEALELCAQIASGVEAAHEAGIIHRDLKPSNIKITPGGSAKVLDFGLARSDDSRSSSSISSQIATVTSPGSPTMPGVILGTAPYMSPEQARGRRLDKRTDVWSFGCILYECLTGTGPFAGETVSDSIGAVLHKDIAFDALPARTPRRVRELLGRMLERDRARRLRDVGDAMLEIEAARAEPGDPDAGAGTRGAGNIAWALVAVLIAIGASVAGWRLGNAGTPEEPGALERFTLTQLTDLGGSEWFPSLSPDGATLVYTSPNGANWDLFSQRVGGFNAINLTDTPDVRESAPAHSPDGSQIAYHTLGGAGGIWVMGATGESPRRVTDSGFDPAWSPDGSTIVYATEPLVDPMSRTSMSSIWEVDASGGEPRQIYAGDAMQPRFSPTGERIVFWAVNEGGNRDLFTIASDGTDLVRLTTSVETEFGPVWTPDGRHVVFSSSRAGGRALWKLPVDPSTGRRTGEPRRVTTGATLANSQARFSTDGTRMVFLSLEVRYEVRRIRLNEDRSAALGPAERVSTFSTHAALPSPSPDGRFIAYTSYGERNEDIFLMNSDGSGRRRLTTDPARDRGASWSPDGSELIFFSDRGGRYAPWAIRTDGSGLRRVVDIDAELTMPFLSPDGARLVCNGNGAIWVFDPREGAASGGELSPLMDGPGTPLPVGWSPDGESLLVLQFGGGSLAAASMNIETLEVRTLVEDPNLLAAEWSPDGERLALLMRNRIELFDVATGRRMLLHAEEDANIAQVGCNFAADGSALYYTANVLSGDLWMMEFDQ